MSSMRKHVKIFAGAPEAASLDWREEGLLNNFTPVFSGFLGRNDPRERIASKSTTTSSAAWPKWRSVPTTIKHLPSGLSQKRKATNHIEHDEIEDHDHTTLGVGDETSFLSNSSLGSHPAPTEPETSLLDPSTSIEGSQLLSQFLEHSFAVHDDLQSSQLVRPTESIYASAHDEKTMLSTTFLTDTSFLTATSKDQSFTSSNSPTSVKRKSITTALNAIPSHLNILSLKEIPSAGYLTSITPQTLTVNLLVGVISIGTSRTVRVRRSGRFMDVLEVLVGDETKSGFSITFWLQPLDSQERRAGDVKDELRSVLAGLRPQDVVMIRDVALSSFRGQVFGQSLNRRITRNVTKLDLLCREPVFEDDLSGMYGGDYLASLDHASPQAAKMRRVREWVSQFVAPGNISKKVNGRVKAKGGQGNGAGLAVDELPPDTQ